MQSGLTPTRACTMPTYGSRTELAEEDLKAIFNSTTLPGSIVVPKVESKEQMMWFFDVVDE